MQALCQIEKTVEEQILCNDHFRSVSHWKLVGLSVFIAQALVRRFVVGEPFQLGIPFQARPRSMCDVRDECRRSAAMTELDVA